MGKFTFIQYRLNAEEVGRQQIEFAYLMGKLFEASNIDLFSTLLQHGSQGIVVNIQTPSGTAIPVEFIPVGATAGLVHISIEGDDDLMLLGVLASGLNPEDDQQALKDVQKVVIDTFHGTATEPAFDLKNENVRPLAASMLRFVGEGRRADVLLYQSLFGSFAAAFFKKLGVI